MSRLTKAEGSAIGSASASALRADLPPEAGGVSTSPGDAEAEGDAPGDAAREGSGETGAPAPVVDWEAGLLAVAVSDAGGVGAGSSSRITSRGVPSELKRRRSLTLNTGFSSLIWTLTRARFPLPETGLPGKFY